MHAHIVLFRPRADLSPADREGLVVALEHALVNIPMIQRARVGRRVTLGRFYDQQNTDDFPYAAVIEFAGATDLQAYLDDPAHTELGRCFFEVAEAALVFDFAMLEAARVRDLLEEDEG